MGERRNKSAVEMMERCHGRLNERAAELCQAAAALAEGREMEASSAAALEVLAFLQRTGTRHIADEEQSVFPRLSADLQPLVQQLSDEHRSQEQLVVRIADLLAPWPSREASQEDGAALLPLAEQLVAHYRDHAALEDEQLLPALAGLAADQQAVITAEMQARREQGRRDGEPRGGGSRGGAGGGGGRGGGGGGRGGGGGSRGGGGGGRGSSGGGRGSGGGSRGGGGGGRGGGAGGGGGGLGGGAGGQGRGRGSGGGGGAGGQGGGGSGGGRGGGRGGRES